jgi:hypothetical protein
MIKSVSMLCPFRVETEEGFKLVLLDLSDNSAYEISGSRVSSEVASEVAEAFGRQQAETMPVVPYDKIQEVMAAEKKLASEGNEHIFRRL